MGSAPTKPGYFIVLEGIDRSGKTTQASALAAELMRTGVLAMPVSFPDRSCESGQKITAHLRGQISLTSEELRQLFYENFLYTMPEVLRLLNTGVTMVCDRYVYSNICYSAALHAKTGLDELAVVAEAMERFENFPLPDLVVYLDVSPETASARGEFGKERYENVETLQKVRKRYMGFVGTCGWVSLDAERPVHELAFMLLKLVQARMLLPTFDRVRDKVQFAPPTSSV